ncbi:MAG: CDP-alcohol phosphatidyltransferase family protein [Candidatus Ranarchaeia archaeon]
MFGKFREAYQKMMNPIGKFLGRLGLSPNFFTALSLIFALITCWFFAIGDLLLGSIFIIITAFIDVFDGSVARATNQVTKFGAVFDHTIDRYVEALFVIGIIFSGYTTWAIGIFALFSMLMASFVRGKAESIGGLESCTVGVAERQEKLALIFGGSLLTWFFPTFSLFTVLPFLPLSIYLSYNIVSLCLILTGILSQITVIQRLKYTQKNAN